MKSLLLILMLVANVASASDSKLGQDILRQFNQLKSVASQLKPDFDVGGYMNGKSYGDHELLWHLAEEPGDAEVIRIFREKGAGEQNFSITFHKNKAIIPGREVIRRFIGPDRTGWRNDTVDAVTGEYLGSQGQANPALDARDEAILKRWLK